MSAGERSKGATSRPLRHPYDSISDAARRRHLHEAKLNDATSIVKAVPQAALNGDRVHPVALTRPPRSQLKQWRWCTPRRSTNAAEAGVTLEQVPWPRHRVRGSQSARDPARGHRHPDRSGGPARSADGRIAAATANPLPLPPPCLPKRASLIEHRAWQRQTAADQTMVLGEPRVAGIGRQGDQVLGSDGFQPVKDPEAMS